MGKSRRMAKKPWWQAFLRERKKEELKKRVAQIEKEREEALSAGRSNDGSDNDREKNASAKERDRRRYHGGGHSRGGRPHSKPSVKCHEPCLVVSAPKSAHGLQIPVWIFDNMVDSIEGAPAEGGTVYVVSKSGKFLGSAIYNSQSKIRARLFSLEQVEFSDAYIEAAIIAAWKRRRAFFQLEDSFRAVFSESDGLPGVIADKLGTVLVVQLLTLAADKHREAILSALQALYDPKVIVVRDDIPVREKEGLPVSEPSVMGELELPHAIELDGITYFCDPVHGQKTGLFLDQRINRKLLGSFVSGKRVLDLYCHVGGWGFVAAKQGAAEVVAVDSSSPAIELARRGAEANQFTNIRFECVDVFDFLSQALKAREEFDVVVCDPPAFAKSHKHLEEAERTYLSLNYRAMKLVAPHGFLITCSCSQVLSDEHFGLILSTAARNAARRFQRIARGSQPPDHPVLVGFPESEYLKCWVLQRLE